MRIIPGPSLEFHRKLNENAMLALCRFGLLLMGLLCTTSLLHAATVDQVQVLGTVMGNKPSSSYAIIAIGNDDAVHFKKGQEVVPGYVLHKILEDKITLKHAGKTMNIKIGVPFSADDFKVESSLPPSYDNAAPAEIPLTDNSTVPPPAPPPTQPIAPAPPVLAPDSETGFEP